MNRIFHWNKFYRNRCRCNESISITKKRKSPNRSGGRPLRYLDPDETRIIGKTFHIKYENQLSLTAKFLLNSFENKYIYYAIDDILYTFQSSPGERDNLLGVLYSPVLSLQNNFSIDFFDIWIQKVYIEETSKTNRFLNQNNQVLHNSTYITIEFLYQIKLPPQKPKPLW